MTLPRIILVFILTISFVHLPADANAYREQGKQFKIRSSNMYVVPPKDWNRLSANRGKYSETWTLDGEQLNDVSFYAGVVPGKPLFKERNKKKNPLPKFSQNILLIEVPELLEKTYRTHKHIGQFELTKIKPADFLGRDGVNFTYSFTDNDGLPRKGDALAVISDQKLYMVTFEAPRIFFFDKTYDDYRQLIATAKIKGDR